jgi:glycosyltransferase involved in cell wall biosynthesis
MESVAVVIPTLNEERAIGSVLERIPVAELLKDGFETTPYVVDGHSTDATREIATRKGAHIVFDEGKGKGAAVRTAFQVVDADYVIMVDGDDTYPISVATEMLRLLQTNDVVVGSRLKGRIEPGAMTRLNIVGNTLLTALARLLFFEKISDLCTGLWGFRSDAIRRLELEACGFEIEAEMFAECVRKGLRIAEIPITYRARKDQPKLSSLRDGIKIGLFLFTRRLQRTQRNGRLQESEETEGNECVKPIKEGTDAVH